MLSTPLFAPVLATQRVRRRLTFFCAALGAVSFARAADVQRFDDGWKFKVGDIPEASAPAFADAGWRILDLPHDWSIETTPSANAPSDGGGGFFGTGIGWYRKTFTAPANAKNHRVSLVFDGVATQATVWVNGQELQHHRYAYTPFEVDLTSQLRSDGSTTVAVRVDNSAQPNSRWYTGSGIYRHVWLMISDPLHVEPNSLFVQTQTASASEARLQWQYVVRNDSAATASLTIESSLLNSDGSVAETKREKHEIEPGQAVPLSSDWKIGNPRLWSPDSPSLYRARIRLLEGGNERDRVETSFGVRTLSVSAERGFLLNGQPVKLWGGNVHHDNGPLGAAAFDRAEVRRVEILKAAGFNAIRTSHNPPSAAFLDACDRLGMLVLDEAFDGWVKPKTKRGYSEVFATNWKADLTAIVQRDRNHPSVVLWSIGNEVYERGSSEGAKLARAMVDCIRSLDTSRPVTAGINGMGKNGDWTKTDALFSALDVAGYNYELTRHTEDHARLPHRVILSTESYLTDVWSYTQMIRENTYVIGDFVWSAMDYLGEAGIGRVFTPDEKVIPHWEGNHFPWHGAACGDIDITGQRKPLSHYRAIIWNRERLSLAVLEPTPDGRPWQVSAWAPAPVQASWTWPGFEGKPLQVEVYSSADTVRLYLNEKVIGEKPAGPAHECRAVFEVPYSPGKLRAVALDGTKETASSELITATGPKRLKLIGDRRQIQADGQDLWYVAVEVDDDANHLQPNANASVHYTVEGPGQIAGIGSADLTSTESYQQNPRTAYRGKALVIIRATHKPGTITLTATAPGLKAATTTIRATRPGK